MGIALDPARRLDQHNGLAPGGAKSTRPGRPWRIATTHGPYPDRSSATKAEHALKSQRGAKRLAWRPPPGE